jgi:ribose/xylose/arabinose/galactoside ABC-type transport system permease subunit
MTTTINPTPTPPTTQAPPPGRSFRSMLTQFGPILALVLVWVLFAAMAGPRFMAWDNTKLMLLQTAVVGIAALGATMIIISGGIDLSIGATASLVTIVVVLVLQAESGGSSLMSQMPIVWPLVAVLAGIATAAAAGGFIGTMITTMRLSPFIATLGMFGAVRGLAKGLAGNTTIYPPDRSWLNELMMPGASGMPAPGVWMLVVLAVIIAAMLRYTRFGRHIFAIGSNEATARLCGVRVERTKLLLYSLAVGLGGIAGVLQCSFLDVTGDPTTAMGLELKVIAAVVIGGASLSGGSGSILGTIVGALIMTIIDNGCTKMSWPNWVQEIATGGIIIAAVYADQLRRRAQT